MNYQPKSYKRETKPEQLRYLPKKADRDAQLAEQKYARFYCAHGFGTSILRRNKTGTARTIKVKLHWDHYIPFSYSQDNRSRNFVAACAQCNLLKHSRIFQSADEARLYLLHARKAARYEPW